MILRSTSTIASLSTLYNDSAISDSFVFSVFKESLLSGSVSQHCDIKFDRDSGIEFSRMAGRLFISAAGVAAAGNGSLSKMKAHKNMPNAHTSVAALYIPDGGQPSGASIVG